MINTLSNPSSRIAAIEASSQSKSPNMSRFKQCLCVLAMLSPLSAEGFLSRASIESRLPIQVCAPNQQAHSLQHLCLAKGDFPVRRRVNPKPMDSGQVNQANVNKAENKLRVVTSNDTYQKEVLDAAARGERVAVIWSERLCGTCRRLMPRIGAIVRAFCEEVKFVNAKVTLEKNLHFAKANEIEAFPTAIILDGQRGIVFKQSFGSTTVDNFSEALLQLTASQAQAADMNANATTPN